MKEQANWQGRPILDPKDHHTLETVAAAREFGQKLPKDEAEKDAYAWYTKQHHMAGAAHHLDGMHKAREAGDQESARKHSLMYTLHLKGAGLDPNGPVPQELKQHMTENPTPHKFKAHKADQLILNAAEKAIS